jgi:hypothetical protein
VATGHERVNDRLRVDLRLLGATHRAGGPDRDPALVEQDRGKERVGRANAGEHRPGEARLQREPGPAVVRDDPGRGLEDPAPEAVGERLDQRDDRPGRVGRHERDRVARRLCVAGHRRERCADHLADGREMAVVEQGLGGHRHPVGIGQVPPDVAERLQEDPRQRVGVGAVRVGVDPEAVDRPENLEQRVARRVRRGDGHVQTRRIEPPAERRDDRRLVRGEVLLGDRRARGAEAPDEGRADRTPVEGLCATGGERLKGSSERGLDEAVAAVERGAAGSEHVCEAGVGLEERGGGAPDEHPSERGRDRRAVVGQGDRARERLGPRTLPGEPVQRRPSRDGSRHGHRDGPPGRDRVAVGGAEGLGVDGSGRSSARVDGEELAVGPMDDREQVAADPAHVRVGDRERGRGGERRVDRAPAPLEGLRAGPTRLDLGGRDRPGGAVSVRRGHRGSV